MLDKKLLAILVCPVCQGQLIYHAQQQELVCKPDALAFPIRDDCSYSRPGKDAVFHLPQNG